MDKQHFDIAIIGGGIMGLSTLYHLVNTTDLKVALFEKTRLGSGSTYKSGGFVRAFHFNQQDVEWAAETLTFLREHQSETGFHDIGCHFLLTDEVDDVTLNQALDHMNQAGESYQLCDANKLKSMIKTFNYNKDKRAIYEPNAGFADPLKTALFYAEQARQKGGFIFEGANVEQLNNNGVFDIVVNGTNYTANKVSLNLGAWTQPFLASANAHR